MAVEGVSAQEDAGGTQKWGEPWKEVFNVGSAGTVPEEGDRLFYSLSAEHQGWDPTVRCLEAAALPRS